MIFVFGSNRQGRHGKGAALTARQLHGAIYGQAEGLQGNSYAIITKELRRDYPKVSYGEIKLGVLNFIKFARDNPQLQFLVAPIGCGLAGWHPDAIAPLFRDHPDNVHLPEEFKFVLKNNNHDPYII